MLGRLRPEDVRSKSVPPKNDSGKSSPICELCLFIDRGAGDLFSAVGSYADASDLVGRHLGVHGDDSAGGVHGGGRGALARPL
uniref:Uncharacterized protein n=1 Tax=Psilocybe cubensis TaxID=181762 RepID=A0A8H8CEW2_PSICU